nr:OmpP1/FadL family transporter [uncultured Gellertiella sp.]
MVYRVIARGLLSVALVGLLSGTAFAGGLERAGYSVDQLFDPDAVTFEADSVLVQPDRTLTNARDTDASDGLGANGVGGGTATTRDTDNYWVPRVGVKLRVFEDVDCLADYSQPWGVHSHPGRNWVGANSNIETKVHSDSYAVTCSYKMDAGQGDIRFIGGVLYQDVGGFKERLVAPISPAFGTGIGRLDLDGKGYGWRAGIAYEIPEYALRASLVYNSEVKLDDITGTLDLRQIPGAINPANPLLGKVTPVFGASAMPDSIELKLQSGIAPDWLAFGSVKWTDWSQLQSIPFCPVATRGIIACTPKGPTRATSLDLLYRDGWTISGGIGHKFNDQWSGAVSVTWDRGTSTGLGTQTDSWTLGTGVSYSPTSNVEFRVAGAVGILTSGSSGIVSYDGKDYGKDVAYDYSNDIVTALSTSLKVKF